MLGIAKACARERNDHVRRVDAERRQQTISPIPHAVRMLALCLVLAALPAGAMAQSTPNPPVNERGQTVETGKRTAPAKKKKEPATTAAPQPALPVSLEQALYLIRSTLLTLNDANRSGNYTVLRDLAAPGLQTQNSAADLAQIFADLRRRKFDLFAVALTAPQLTAAPAVDADRMLRLTGFFPTRPLQIRFDLLYQNVAGQWRLFGISVATPEAQPQAQQQGAAQAASTKRNAPAAR